MTARLIGIDWGTSSFRAWLMGDAAAVLAEIPSGPGILAVPGGDFDAAFQTALGPWLAATPDLPVIASGMITSRNGWVETPYLPLPLDATALADALTTHRTRNGHTVHFVTGAIQNPHDGRPDVMRGEETEIIGHLAAGGGDGLFVLPGTHSKWARHVRRPAGPLRHLHDGRGLCPAARPVDPWTAGDRRRPQSRRLPPRAAGGMGRRGVAGARLFGPARWR